MKTFPWNDFKFIITECTFINDLTINANELADKKMHNSYKKLLPAIKKIATPCLHYVIGLQDIT